MISVTVVFSNEMKPRKIVSTVRSSNALWIEKDTYSLEESIRSLF